MHIEVEPAGIVPVKPVAFLLAAGLLLAGCSGGSTQRTGTVDQPTAAGLTTAAAREADDFFRLSVAAYYADLSAACRAKITVENLATLLTQADADAKKDVVGGLRGLKAGPVQTREVTPTKGQALVTIVRSDGSPLGGTPAYDDYVYEGGKWRTTVCGTS